MVWLHVAIIRSRTDLYSSLVFRTVLFFQSFNALPAAGAVHCDQLFGSELNISPSNILTIYCPINVKFDMKKQNYVQILSRASGCS